MINRILTLFSLTIVSVLSSAAQIPITFKNNWMYVDASLSYGGNNIPVQAMIDTGCTYCVIDSAFAATSAIISRDSVLLVIVQRNRHFKYQEFTYLSLLWVTKSIVTYIAM